ncbi:MAG: DUF1344 domain-containing protein [Cypionkella sp.]
MRKILFPTVIAAVMASTLGAFAADTSTTGTIKALDMKAMSITLNDGTVYMLPKGFKDPGLKVGEKVVVGWKLANKIHEADTVAMAK